MQVKERTKQEIEAKLATMGDYVKIDYLERVLKMHLDFETRKYALTVISGLYENRGMFNEAARARKGAAEINTTFRSKIQDYMKSIQLFIRGASFQDADFMFAQALALGNEKDKMEMRAVLKSFYLNEAKDLLARDKRNQAKKVYEKALNLDLNPQEKQHVQQQLLGLYEKLGNVQEFLRLKKSM
jgi:tetratricopeptide (TPR) repeat protein